MPDIIINWNDDAKITTELLTTKYGIGRSNAPGCALPPYYTGNHRPNAFMVSVGFDISQGAVCESTSILDLAPTILDQFGIKAPDYMDGRVLSQMRSSKQGQTRTIETGSPDKKSVIA
jgi:predicted AlkP superfamily phosphohydrolase/phosphomutase